MHTKMGRKGVIAFFLAVLLILPAVSAFADLDYWYTGIFVDTLPNKVVYEVNEPLDLTGLKLGLSIEYKDGTKAVKFQDHKGLTYSPGVLTTPGKQTVTLSLTAIGEGNQARTFKTTFEVTVNEEGDSPTGWTESISITTKPKKLEYLVGDKFDASGMVVKANQVNLGQSEKVTLPKSMYTVSPTKFTTGGKQQVTVTALLNDKNGNTESFSAYVTVTVYDKIKISKSPGGETVEEGGSCKFTARAKNYTELEWFFEKDGKKVSAADAAKTFGGLKIKGYDGEKIELSNIPVEMDDWSVYCVFTSPMETKTSGSCKLRVSEKPTDTPTAAPTPAPTDTPTSVPTDTPTAAPTEEPADAPVTAPASAPTDSADPFAAQQATDTPDVVQPTAHTHSYAGQFRSDDDVHWMECACGERTGIAAHVVTEWKEFKRATAQEDGLQMGACVVCGRMIRQKVAYEGGLIGRGGAVPWIIGGIAAAVLLIVPPLLIVSLVLHAKKRRRATGKPSREKAQSQRETERERPERDAQKRSDDQRKQFE